MFFGSMKKTARTAWVALSPGLDHAVFAGYLHGDVLDEGEFHLDILHSLVLYLLLYRAEPCDVAVETVHGETDELGVERLELLGT